MAEKPRVINGVLYDERDSDVERNRTGRLVVFLVSVILAGLVPALIVSFALSYIPLPGMASLGFILGFVAGHLKFADVSPKFFVTVPPAQAYITLNTALALFNIEGSPYATFGPGTSLDYPWATRGERGNLSLATITMSFKEEVPGNNCQLIVAGSYQLKVDIKNAPRFQATDESTISGGAVDKIKSEISQDLADKSPDEAKREIRNFNERLGEKFGVGTTNHTNAAVEVQNFESSYGLVSVATTISGIDLPPDAQKTRDAVDEAAQAIRSVATMYGIDEKKLRQKIDSGEIPISIYNEMLDRTLVQGKAATMTVEAKKYGGLEWLAPIIEKLVPTKGEK